MIVEKIVLNEAREVSLTAYLQDTGAEIRNICKRPAVIINSSLICMLLPPIYPVG